MMIKFITEMLLKNYYFYYFLFLFTTIILSLLVNFKLISKQFDKIKRRTWIILSLIFLTGLIIRLFFIPHIPQIYYDEYYHLNYAEIFATRQEFCTCRYYLNNTCYNCILLDHPPGHHFLLSLMFIIFGVSTEIAFNFSAVLSSLSIILMFLASYLIFKKENAALWSSLILCFLPVHLKISGSTALEVSSFFFMLLSLVGGMLLLYIKTKKLSIFYLFLLILIYTIQVRPENFILIPIFLIFLVLFDKEFWHKLRENKLSIPLCMFILLVVPHFMHLIYNFKYLNFFHEYGDSLSERLNHLKFNLDDNLLFFFDNRLHPRILTFFTIIGAVFLCNKNKRILLFLMIWFLLFLILYSSNINGNFSLKHKYDSWRYTLPLYIPIIIFAKEGISEVSSRISWSKLKMMFNVLLIFLIVSNYFLYYQFIHLKNPFQEEYEELSSYKNKTDDKCVIVASRVSPSAIRYTVNRDSIAIEKFERLVNSKSIKEEDCYLFLEGFYPFGESSHENFFKKYKLVQYDETKFFKIIVNSNQSTKT